MRNRAKATQNVWDGRNHLVRKQAMIEASLRLIHEDGKSVKYAATVCGIPQSTLYRWKQDGIDDVSRIRRPGRHMVLITRYHLSSVRDASHHDRLRTIHRRPHPRPRARGCRLTG
jgi:hypothetical protein